MAKPRAPINTPAKFQAAREYLGLDPDTLAHILRLGRWGRQTVRRIEQGDTLAGPYQVAMEALLTGWRPHMRKTK